MTGIGTLLVWYFSKNLKALDTLDFWVGTLLIYIQATILIIIFGWTVGIEKGWSMLHQGAAIRAPRFFKPLIKYVTPAFLLTIFVLFLLKNAFGWNFSFGEAARFEPTGYIRDLVGEKPDGVARLSVLFIAIIAAFGCVVARIAGKKWEARPPHPGSN